MCTAAPKKAPHPQLSTHFTIVVQPKSVQIVVNDPFQWVGGGLLRYLGRPAAGRRSASRAPKRRLWCYIRTQHAQRNTFERVLVLNSWNGTQNYCNYTSKPCAENQYLAFQNRSNIHIRLDSFTLKRYQQSSVYKENRSLVSTKNYVNLNLKNSSSPVWGMCGLRGSRWPL